MSRADDLHLARALILEAIALCDAAGADLAANHMQLGADRLERTLPAVLREERAAFNGKT